MLVFDTLLLPQGRDMNYGLYYACFVSGNTRPSIVSSMNPQAVKRDGSSFYTLSLRHSPKKFSSVDKMVLYVRILC